VARGRTQQGTPSIYCQCGGHDAGKTGGGAHFTCNKATLIALRSSPSCTSEPNTLQHPLARTQRSNKANNGTLLALYQHISGKSCCGEHTPPLPALKQSTLHSTYAAYMICWTALCHGCLFVQQRAPEQQGEPRCYCASLNGRHPCRSKGPVTRTCSAGWQAVTAEADKPCTRDAVATDVTLIDRLIEMLVRPD
jgi:hypothetical protein